MDPSVFEALELEQHMFGLLAHFTQLASSPDAAKHLSSSATLCMLLKILYPASQHLWLNGGLLVNVPPDDSFSLRIVAFALIRRTHF